MSEANGCRSRWPVRFWVLLAAAVVVSLLEDRIFSTVCERLPFLVEAEDRYPGADPDDCEVWT